MWWSVYIAPRIVSLSTRWRRVVSLTPRLLYPEKGGSRQPLDRMLGGHQSRFGNYKVDNKVYCTCLELNANSHVVYLPVPSVTELSGTYTNYYYFL
jgi:hypothetical protein